MVNSVKVTITLPGDIFTAVKTLAQYEDRTISNMVAVLLKEGFKFRSWPLISFNEWFKLHFQATPVQQDKIRAFLPYYVNLEDFITKFQRVPSWDLDDERIVEESLRKWVKQKFVGNKVEQPIFKQSLFGHDEDNTIWVLEVPFYRK